MLFTSPVFLFIFLPFVIIIYFLTPKKYRNLILLISSLIFYAWGEQEIVVIMLVSIVTDYLAGKIIYSGRKKIGLILSISINLLMLTIFKYFSFIVDNLNVLLDTLGAPILFTNGTPEISLPIGISFFTFQTMSYTIDVYYGKAEHSKNIIDFGTYVTLFPQLIAGPIVKYVDISEQLKERNIDLSDLSIGIERFIIGLSKKLIFANYFGLISDTTFNRYEVWDLSSGAAWLGMICYTLHIYFDFSGYSDMAIGLSRIFGFKINENFNYPYISRSIKEFWRRWHISLSTWFRNYLYIPLGGNRISTVRTYQNLLIVFFVTGLWHGAAWNFIVWGMFHGLFLIIERVFLGDLLAKIPKFFSFAYTLIVVIVGWVFFRVESMAESLGIIKLMFVPTKGKVNYDFLLTNEGYFLIPIGIIFCTPLLPKIKEKLKKYDQSSILNLLFKLSLVILLLYNIGLIASQNYNPFIYFRF